MLAQPLDPMQIQLYGMTAERRPIFFRQVIFMANNAQFRVIFVQPLRRLLIAYEPYVSHPGCKLFYTPEPETQQIPVTVSLIPFVLCICSDKFILPFSPLWIIAIDPGNHEINMTFSHCCSSPSHLLILSFK